MENNQKVTMASAKSITTGIRLTVIDSGNYNMKFIGEDSQGSFSSRISNDYQPYEEGFERIELDSKLYYLQVGELIKEYNKAEKDNIPQILYAICRANSNQEIIETNLTLLLPTGQMQNKPKLMEKLKNKEFSFRFNGKDRVLKIHEVIILPEGYISYFSLSSDDKKGSIAIIDIGSRTVNLAIIHNGKVEKLATVKLGSYDFYTKVKNIQNASGDDFVEEDIQRLIDENIIKVYQKQYIEFLNDIINSIKGYVNLKTYKCIFTGGTSLMLKEHISQLKLPNFKIHDDAANSNVKGALEASRIMLKENA